MRRLKLILAPGADMQKPPEGMDFEQERQWRISLLTNEERMAFQWFRQGYTKRWTAETMLLDNKTAKKMFRSVFNKLHVSDEAEISRVFRAVRLTKEELPDEEIQHE